jgi:hypothetical protein
MNEPIHPTVTKIHRDVMDSGCVEDAEVFRTSRQKRAWSTAVPKLDMKT